MTGSKETRRACNARRVRAKRRESVIRYAEGGRVLRPISLFAAVESIRGECGGRIGREWARERRMNERAPEQRAVFLCNVSVCTFVCASGCCVSGPPPSERGRVNEYVSRAGTFSGTVCVVCVVYTDWHRARVSARAVSGCSLWTKYHHTTALSTGPRSNSAARMAGISDRLSPEAPSSPRTY